MTAVSSAVDAVAPGPSEPLISCRDVTKSFRAGARQVQILHGISVKVREQEICDHGSVRLGQINPALLLGGVGSADEW